MTSRISAAAVSTPTPRQNQLWSIGTVDIVFTAVNQRKQFFTGPGPLVENIYIEADVGNTDTVCVGNANMSNSGNFCLFSIAILHPSQWLAIEPEEFTTNGFDGVASENGVELMAIQLFSKFEVFDASQLYGLSGPNLANQKLHVSIGLRERVI